MLVCLPHTNGILRVFFFPYTVCLEENFFLKSLPFSSLWAWEVGEQFRSPGNEWRTVLRESLYTSCDLRRITLLALQSCPAELWVACSLHFKYGEEMLHLCIYLTTRLGLPVTAGSSTLCCLGLGHGRLRMVVGNESGQTGSFYTELSLWRGSGTAGWLCKCQNFAESIY